MPSVAGLQPRSFTAPDEGAHFFNVAVFGARQAAPMQNGWPRLRFRSLRAARTTSHFHEFSVLTPCRTPPAGSSAAVFQGSHRFSPTAAWPVQCRLQASAGGNRLDLETIVVQQRLVEQLLNGF